MKFLDDNFLLKTDVAKNLYHKYAAKMPIFDYHCHLPPDEIAEDRPYSNISEIWFGDDHYKWRALRLNGIDESFITGDATDKEKFIKWAEIVPSLIGNPLYHWTHLELKNYFGIDKTLSADTAQEIWEECNRVILEQKLSPRKLIKMSNVKALCTTDDPIDNLEYHIEIAKDVTFDVKVLPTFRPDNALNIEKDGFISWLVKLEEVVGFQITDLNMLTIALIKRIEFFSSTGCCIADHGLDELHYRTTCYTKAEEIFEKKMNNKSLSFDEIWQFKSYLLNFLGLQYSRLNWTMQLHIGALRNTNTRMVKRIGESKGYDGINDRTFAVELSNLLNDLERIDSLPKTILYNLNPRDNYVLGALSACFQSGSVKAKVQFGSGWWFCDQKDGMTEQIKALANLGILSGFVGMLTDSRSFLSYTRHEYFRRLLCAILGQWIEDGEFPDNEDLVGKIVQDICFNNAGKYFGI